MLFLVGRQRELKVELGRRKYVDGVFVILDINLGRSVNNKLIDGTDFRPSALYAVQRFVHRNLI